MIRATFKLTRQSGFSLNVELSLANHVTALYGPSGSGKTTILRLLAGLERGSSKDAIHIEFDDETWQDETNFVPPHQRGIGYVFQHAQLFPHLTVSGNLAYAERRSRRSNVTRDQVLGWLDVQPLLDKRVDSLSGGEAQRVAMARVLLGGPRCILMDEPLGSVDKAARSRILPYLARLHEELDIPMIYVSHSLDEVNYLADDVCVLDRGRVILSGSVFETSTSLELEYGEGESIASVALCTFEDWDRAYELAELRFGDHKLHVASQALTKGHSVRVRIPAKDVSIALDQPSNTSILNVLPATIDDIKTTSHPGIIVRLAIGGQFILALITRKSLAALNLKRGQTVFAQIKGVALMTDHAN
jgi:molybdate transport system ATP-binding protein